MTGSDSLPTDALLYRRRPDWLEARIRRDFAAASQLDPSESYGFNGKADGYIYRYAGRWPRHDRYVGSDDLVASAAERRPAGRPLRVLDVGCGAAAMVAAFLREGHQAQGLSACDYRPFPQFRTAMPLDFPTYLLGDAHQLDETPGIDGSYDLILSRNTIDKLVDPLSAVEQMAGRVGVGGVLAIDGFRLAQVDERDVWPDNRLLAPDMVGMLLESGFEHLDEDIAGHIDERYADHEEWAVVAPLMLRRIGDAPVRFAVDYADPPLVPKTVGTSPVVRYLLQDSYTLARAG